MKELTAQFDLTIIGGGPGGYEAAIYAAKFKARVALIERADIGGSCLNRGCIPTKALQSTAKLIEDIRNKSEDFGISTGEIKLDFAKAVERKNKVTEDLIKGIQTLLKYGKITVFKGHGTIIGGKIDDYEVEIAGEKNLRIKTARIIIATGSKPNLVPTFNIDNERILTTDDVLSPDFKTLPESILIIGAGIIGCEFANIYGTFGVKVTMLEFLGSPIATEEQVVINELKKKFNQMGIELHVEQNVLKIENTGSGVRATCCSSSIPRKEIESAEKVIYQADLCLVSIGRTYVTENLGIENVGIKIRRGRIICNRKTLETAAKGIYAVGDVTGGLMLAHVASSEGIVAVSNALSSIGRFDMKPRETEYGVVPITIFTSPEIGSVGLREKAAKERGKISVGRFGYASLGRAKTMGEETGFLMIIGDTRTDKILGASCIGHSAAELISEIAVAMKAGMTCAKLSEVIHSHPTLSEIVLEAAEDVYGLSIHRASRRKY